MSQFLQYFKLYSGEGFMCLFLLLSLLCLWSVGLSPHKIGVFHSFYKGTKSEMEGSVLKHCSSGYLSASEFPYGEG